VPKLRVFRLWRRAEADAWLAWRRRVVEHELRKERQGNTWRQAPWGYYVALDRERKHWWHQRDTDLVRHLSIGLHSFRLALWWADDNYWAIQPTLEKG